MRRAPLAALGVLIVTLPMEATAATLERQPYLQRVSDSEVTIVWTTLAGSTGEIHWGMAPGSLSNVEVSASTGTQHEVTISGLTADTKFYYEVWGDAAPMVGDDLNHFFETSPVPGSREKFRVWAVGDSGTGGSTQAAVRDSMQTWVGPCPPQLYLHVGDMAYNDGTYAEFTSNFYAPYQNILRNTPVWPALGNHEGRSSDSPTQSGPYYDGYVLPTNGEAGGLPSGTEAYYSFDYANAHFVILDSYDTDRSPTGTMATWAVNDINDTMQEWVIAYWHHPPYTDGTHDSDLETRHIEMREWIMPLLENAGVDLVLGGHSHIYERSYLLDGAYDTPTTNLASIIDTGDGRPGAGDGPYVKPPGVTSHNGAVYVVAGHGGTGVGGTGNHPMMFFSEVANGSVILDIHENRLDITNVRVDGTVTDTASVLKGDGIVVATPNGGESIALGGSVDVTWSSVGTVGGVDVEYSCDKGENWVTLASNVPNTGSWTWNVPNVTTTEALVRVVATNDASLRDESNAGFSIGTGSGTAVIGFGDVWSYDDQGVDHGTAWQTLAFDDSGWASGPGQLGYGDGDEATLLFNPDPNYPSHYFRKVINVADPVLAANITALYDDGIAVWINGTEVANWNASNTSYAAFADGVGAENGVSTAAISLSPNPFVVGDNVVAAMVKQASGTSSDVSFDFELELTFDTGMGAACMAGDGDGDGDGDGTTGGDGDGTSGDGDGDGTNGDGDGTTTGGDGDGTTTGGDGDGTTTGGDGDGTTGGDSQGEGEAGEGDSAEGTDGASDESGTSDGMADAGLDPNGSGCACSVEDDGVGGLGGLGLLLIPWARRKRRRRRR